MVEDSSPMGGYKNVLGRGFDRLSVQIGRRKKLRRQEGLSRKEEWKQKGNFEKKEVRGLWRILKDF